MKTFMFPGQGSQSKGMGKELFDKFPDLIRKANDILGYSIEALCLTNPDNQLGQTQYTQPAIFTISALTYLTKMEKGEAKPDFVAGHSLGEYDALFVSGVFDFETGLTLVKKRGELMSKAHGGGMAAVVGLTDTRIEEILAENKLTNIAIANYNTPSQFVIAGPKEDILAAKETFVSGGARMYVPLKVSGAFHTQYMADAQQKFSRFLEDFSFGEISIPVISNVTARPYESDRIKKNLIDQITHSVKWTETVRYLMGAGDMVFEEVGPGKVLAGLVAKIKKEPGKTKPEKKKQQRLPKRLSRMKKT